MSKKNHKAFVYAREKDTDIDRCNWAYGHTNSKDAIESAMKGCQSYVLNAECIVVDIDGDFSVKEGQFTPIEPVDDRPLSKQEKKSLEEEAKKVIRGNCLPFFTKNYLDAKGHKSFAYSVDKNGYYACGYAYKSPTKNSSDKIAIDSCEKNKAKRGKKRPKTPCKVYAVAHTILLKPKDFGVTSIQKKKIFLSSKEYNKRLNQAKRFIDDGACLLQMKYYLRGEQEQAFYFAKSDGKQACGRYDSALALDAAKSEAKNRCEAMAKRRGIKKECKLIAENFEIVTKESDFKEKKILNYEEALHKGNIEQLKDFISKGHDPNTQTKKDGITALFVAAGKGDREFFLWLIKKGANINHIAKDKSTLLHAAVLGKNIEITKYLLDKGLDINAKGFDGMTPLHVSMSMLDMDMVKLLLQRGADPKIKDDKGRVVADMFKGLKLNLDEFMPKKDDKAKRLLDNLKKLKTKDSTKMFKPQSLEKSLKIATEHLNKTLPMMTDEHMRLEKVVEKDKSMTFEYTLVNFTNWTMTLYKLKHIQEWQKNY
jgi:hypothetical protein